MESLHIPMGVKNETEMFPGFGQKEFFQAMIGFLASGVIAFLVFLFTGIIASAMLVLLTSMAASVMMTVKDQYNLSVVTQIAYMVRFAKSQKRYRYVYGREWGED